MSLFGLGDFEDDFMGSHMNAMNMQMRSMNRLMNSFMPDPFNMLAPFDGGMQQNALMERGHGNPLGGLFGFPAMPNINRLLNADIGNPNGASFCSSSVVTMTSGPDGRPQIYQASTSTKTGPGGVRETRKTVQDSRRGIKKMAIGHHIGDRAHIIEKEQDLNSGQMEERQEFINLDEEEAQSFDREFVTRANVNPRAPREVLTIEDIDDDEEQAHYRRQGRRQLPALPEAPSHSSSVHPHPYNPSAARRNHRSKHSQQHQQPHPQIVELLDDTEEEEAAAPPPSPPAQAAAAAAPRQSPAKHSSKKKSGSNKHKKH